ncbi:hypothetical protein B4U79_15311, partial [Dinothrombium tinctorium]
MRPSNLTEPSNCPILTNLVRPQTKPQATVASSNQPFRTPMILQRDPMGRVMNRLCNRLKRMEMALRRNPNVERARFEGNLRMTRTEDGRVICFRCNQPGHYSRFCTRDRPLTPMPQRKNPENSQRRPYRTIKIDKLLYATVSYDGTHTEVRFLVVKEFAFPALLGLDWCRRAEVNINFGKCFEVTPGLDWIPIPKRNPQVICRLPETFASVHVTSNAGRRKQYNLKITGTTSELNYDLIHHEDRSDYITITIDNPTDRNLDVETNISAYDEYDDFESVNNPVMMIPPPLTNLEVDLKAILSENERESFFGLMWQFRNLFKTSNQTLTRTNITSHRIDTGDARPINQAPYRASLREFTIIEEQITEMLIADIIEPSRSPWASP